MIFIGVVDIFIGARILKEKENFGQYIRIFAYVTLVAGILEVSIIGVPLSLLAVPATTLIMALIFFRDDKEVEFV